MDKNPYIPLPGRSESPISSVESLNLKILDLKILGVRGKRDTDAEPAGLLPWIFAGKSRALC